jgi:hypothetical protein
MFAWFNAVEFQRFGEQLAVQVVEKLPLQPAVAPNDKGSRKGKRKAAAPQDVLRRLMTEVQMFSSRNKANFYKKAKFGNAFKWKLREAGYDAEFVDELTMELMLHFR